MDVLGTVEDVSDEGIIIVKGETAPEYDDTVYDSKQKKIGTVKRVFGPVSGPYISVRPIDKTVLKDVTGKKVYFERGTQHGKNKRRNG